MLQTARSPDDVRWLPGAQLNIAESALSMRDPDAPALIWAAEEAPDTLHTLSLGELHREAMRFAAALRTAGFSPGEMKMENMTHLQASCTSASYRHNVTFTRVRTMMSLCSTPEAFPSKSSVSYQGPGFAGSLCQSMDITGLYVQARQLPLQCQ